MRWATILFWIWRCARYLKEKFGLRLICVAGRCSGRLTVKFTDVQPAKIAGTEQYFNLLRGFELVTSNWPNASTLIICRWQNRHSVLPDGMVVKVRLYTCLRQWEACVTPQNVILTENVITIAANCNNNAKCNKIDAKCNKIVNAKCNNFLTQNEMNLLTQSVMTQYVITRKIYFSAILLA